MSLMNGPAVADAVADPKGTVARLVLAGRGEREIIEEIYLAALAYFARGGGRAAAAQDLLWALLNSNAFLFNR